MDTISLGSLQTSRIAYGCMTLGGLDDARDIHAAVDAALAGGITLFDHADIYANGRSEEAFGRLLAERPGLRDQVVLQTKCGIRRQDEPPGTVGRYDFSYEHITASVDESLRRLGVDAVDVLMLHRPDPLMEPDEVARAFDDLASAGKVRAFGVSNCSVAQIDRLAASLSQPLVANQIQLSLGHLNPVTAGVEVNRPAASPTEGLLDGCALRDVRVQAWAPVAGGAFSRSDPAPEHADLADAVRQIAERMGAAPVSVVLAWVLRLPHGVQPVVGSTTPSRIAACCAAADLELSREDWYTLFATARGERLP